MAGNACKSTDRKQVTAGRCGDTVEATGKAVRHSPNKSDTVQP